MIHVNLLENCVPEKRELATPKEVFEVTLVIFFVTVVFSALILFTLNGLVPIFSK